MGPWNISKTVLVNFLFIPSVLWYDSFCRIVGKDSRHMSEFFAQLKTKQKIFDTKNDFELILKLTWLNNKSFFSLNICLVDKISCYCRTNLVIVGKTSLVRLKIKGLWIVEKMQKKCFHSKQKGGNRTTFCFWNNFYVNETEIHNVWKYSALSTSSLIFFYYLYYLIKYFPPMFMLCLF